MIINVVFQGIPRQARDDRHLTQPLGEIGLLRLLRSLQPRNGAMLVNKKAYIKAGMENERFYGWGPEDFERYDRRKILGLKIHRSKGPLFHLTHSRGSNSTFRSMEQAMNTNKELSLTHFSSKEELLHKLQIPESMVENRQG